MARPPSPDATALRAFESDDSSRDHEHELHPRSNPPPNHELLTNQFETLDNLEGQLYDFAARAGFSVGVIKQRFTEEQKASIANYVDLPAINNREIPGSMRERFPGIVFTSY
ncbi:hypothetical protein B0T14DRAFT_566885 [Immersiella caudata]|uniref:Uncharacterized protein n=1 Tax=Immersiella caudata TaxID=314043 RepID=A0AA40C097_9PEZI|nr:hypothetical protein B0T14DRAFT_566885 [Immersiella caudata]